MKSKSLLAGFAVAFALSLAPAGMTHAAEITGTVKQKDGKPIEGATVKISTAGLRTGSSPLCPSCWADCAKFVRTGSDGRFRIPDVSDELVFDLLVLADGHAPAFIEEVDPSKGGSANAVLKARDLALYPPTQLWQGHVLGPEGQPIAGARVYPTFAQKGLDAEALTDADGRFVLACSEPVKPNWLKIHAGGFLSALPIRTKIKQGLPKPVEVKLSRGVTIIGRVLDKQGKPASGVKMGAIMAERSFEIDRPPVDAETGAEGTFSIFNAPANDELVIYGLMNSLAGRGAVPLRVIKTGADETMFQAGDFAIERACKLSGQFRLPEGKTFPAETRVHIGRDAPWDSQIVAVAPDGRFEVDGLPRGEVIQVSLPDDPADHAIQSVNGPFEIDWMNSHVEVVLSGDMNDLKIDLVWKDAKARQAEWRPRTMRDRYAEFLKAESFSPEREALFIAAKVREEDHAIEWRNPDKASAACEKELRAALGDQIFERYREFEELAEGRYYVSLLTKFPRGEWITAAEKEALVRSIVRHLKQYYEGEDIDWKKAGGMLEGMLKRNDGRIRSILAAGAEALPPEKQARFREWVDAQQSRELVTVHRDYDDR